MLEFIRNTDFSSTRDNLLFFLPAIAIGLLIGYFFPKTLLLLTVVLILVGLMKLWPRNDDAGSMRELRGIPSLGLITISVGIVVGYGLS